MLEDINKMEFYFIFIFSYTLSLNNFSVKWTRLTKFSIYFIDSHISIPRNIFLLGFN